MTGGKSKRREFRRSRGLLLRRVAVEKALPFEPLTPYAETIAAMREARQGKLPRFKNVEDLLRDLNAGD